MIQIQSSKKQSTYPLRDQFKQQGFHWNPNTRAWEIPTIDDSLLKSYDRLGLKITDTSYDRSTDYRTQFFRQTHPPYHCAYCGTKLTRRTLEVDHWIPVAKLRTGKHRRWYQRLLRWFCHTDNPNQTRNLVCACSLCNRKKKTRTGFWLIRGWFGRNYAYWVFWKFTWILTLCYGIAQLIPR